MNASAPSCWVISDGRRGIENQALGLAEAIARTHAITITPYHVLPGTVFKAASPKLQSALKPRPRDYGLPETPPDLVIGCGRQAIAPLLAIKKAWPDTFTAYVQDPRMNPALFDLVIAPKHDRLSGPNVETMIGSPNRITRDLIATETLEFAARLNTLPRPRAAFLIGGPSGRYDFTDKDGQAHIVAAKTLLAAGQSLLVSTSRRTPDKIKTLWQTLPNEHENIWLYEGGDPNPYFAFLGGGDMILVTEDSTNMLTEAASTGKAVFRLPLSGDAGKFESLYNALEARCGMTRWQGQLSGDDYIALDETARIAEIFWARFKASRET